MISLELILQRNEDLFFSAIDNELIMMAEDNNSYFGLNETGKMLWEFLKTPQSFYQVIQNFSEEYQISFDQCHQDLEPFIQEMMSFQLILP